jgi:hypothetical protein
VLSRLLANQGAFHETRGRHFGQLFLCLPFYFRQRKVNVQWCASLCPLGKHAHRLLHSNIGEALARHLHSYYSDPLGNVFGAKVGLSNIRSLLATVNTAIHFIHIHPVFRLSTRINTYVL